MLTPGLSGGVFAVSLGIYPRIMRGIADFVRHPFAVIKDLLWIVIGGLVGLLATFLLLMQLIEIAPLPFTALFIGFIIGSVPDIASKVRKDVSIWLKAVLFLVFFGLIIAVPFLPMATSQIVSMNIGTILFLLLVGFIIAGTLIVPGISGSLVLMALGIYVYLLETIRDFANGIISFDGAPISSTILPLIIVVIGFALGLLVFSKAINYLLAHHQSALYAGVLGLLAASPFSILYEAINEYPSLFDHLGINLPLAIIALVGSFFLAIRMNKLERKKTSSTIDRDNQPL